MAKKDKKDSAEEEKKNEAADLDRLQSEIDKEFGKGVMVDASLITEENLQIIPTCPSLDGIIGGGIPEGSWVSMAGPPKCGKTTSLLTFAAECQKKEYGARQIHFMNVEGRLKKRDLQGIRGLNLDPDMFKIYTSTRGQILSSQNYLTIATKLLQSCPMIVLIIDSISALCDSRELEGGIGTETRGGGQKLVSQFCRTVANVVPVQKSIVCGVTHLIADTSGRTQGKIESAANKWLYQADLRLKATHATPWRVGAEDTPQIGQTIHWVCLTSPLGPPGLKCDTYLRYGVGIDKEFETFNTAEALGLIEKSGAWYTLSFMKNHLELLGEAKWDDEVAKTVRAQGGEKAYQMLASRPAWVNALRGDIAEFLQGKK